MISRMAMDDIEALRADGIEVPPREVVRLNALGLRVERGKDCAEIFAAPRVAFLGDVVLHEPELGGEMWMRQAADAFDMDEDQTFFSLRVLVCVTPWRDLPPPTDAGKVQAAISALFKRLSPSTVRQVEAALRWVCDGDNPSDGESPPPKAQPSERRSDDQDDMPPRYSPEFGLFWRGMALRIGTAADMKDMTFSAMMAACDRAEELSSASAFGGGIDRKRERDNARGDYFRALDAVRTQGKEAG